MLVVPASLFVAVTSFTAPLPAPAVCAQRCSMLQLSSAAEPTKAEKLVRERLNPRADLSAMDEQDLRKYSYAMQIEMRRLLREEKAAAELRRGLLELLNEKKSDTTISSVRADTLVAAMKMEGLVRYGLAYATASTSWDKVRKNHPQFADMTDAELYSVFQDSGQGISGTFGDLF